MTTIEWTMRPGTKGETWNPIRARSRATGKVGWWCVRVNDACRSCYASAMNDWRGNNVDYAAQRRNEVDIFLDEKTLAAPLRWRAPRTVFVCSMSDLFGEWVTDDMLDRIFAVMALTPQHTYLVLTKRPARARAYLDESHVYDRIDAVMDGVISERVDPLDRRSDDLGATAQDEWPLPNVWLGVSVHDQASADEFVPILLATPAAKRFLSLEPCLGAVDLSQWLGGGTAHDGLRAGVPGAVGDRGVLSSEDLEAPRLDWVIVGGESGPKARPFDLAWARSTIAQGKAAGVPAFVKQLGARPVDGCGNDEPDFIAKCDCGALPIEVRDRKGGDPAEWPEDLRVREWPA